MRIIVPRPPVPFPGPCIITGTGTKNAAAGGGFSQGQLYTVTGVNFGTRPDYNIGNYQYHGHRHMHFRWITYQNAFPANGSSKATFLAALDGAFPANNFTFNSNPGSLQMSLQTGGPSQSGRYFRRAATSGIEGAIETESGSDSIISSNTPNMYVCYKHRGQGNGKMFRVWFSGASPQEDVYIGGGGIYKENSTYWDATYDAVAGNSFAMDVSTWRRHQYIQLGGNNTVATNYASSSFWVNGVVQDYEAYHNGNPVSPRPSGLPCMRPTQSMRNCEFSWCNSLDPGGIWEYADQYQDFTIARVEITGANGKVEIQPCFSWADGQIVIIANKGEMNSGTGTLRVYSALNAVLATQSIVVG